MAAMVVVALLVAGVVGLSLYAYSHNGRIYEGVKVGDVAVGGMTRESAEAAIQARYDDYATMPLSVVAEGVVFTFTPAEAGASLNQAATLDAAYSYGREGSILGAIERLGARPAPRSFTIAPYGDRLAGAGRAASGHLVRDRP